MTTRGSARRDVVVYDAFWSTAGGGETYAAGVAEALARDHDVTLLAHEPLDPAWLGERLGFDLSSVEVQVVDPCEPLEAVTADHDLLVNLSYRNHGRNGARRGVYVVHFPDRPGAGMAGWQRSLVRAGAPLRRRPARLRVVGGFHEPDVIRWHEVRWTNGHGRLAVGPGWPGGPLRLWFGRFLPGGEARTITVEVDGAPAAVAELAPPRSKLEVLEPLSVTVPLPAGPAEVSIHSDAVVADTLLGNGDRRCLGVPLVGITTGRSPLDVLRARASLVAADPPGTSYLDSYDLVVANSAFTARWVERWWGRPSTVLEPPVSLRTPGPKDAVIASVGRFFAPGRGHAKKQLELVEAFRELCRRVDGWELHLAGGCSAEDVAYLDAVREAARGLPVELHVDASGAEVDELYRRASIYWHATGLGEDLDVDPVRAEHFGITTVEAMSAGAVPVVIAAGGQPEIVRPEVDGLLFRTLDELVDQTERLIGDDAARRRMAAEAVARSQRYGRDAFAERLHRLLDPLW